VIEAYATELEVVVQRVVSPLDTGSIHGRGQGVLHDDRNVGITFLLDHTDFVDLRQRMLRGGGEVRFSVSMGDVTAIDAAGDQRPGRPPAAQVP